MISMSTAKFLFFLAMTLGPQSPHVILATSNSENYVWTDKGPDGWLLKTKGLPTCDWNRVTQAQQAADFDSDDARAVTACHWQDGSRLLLPNGNRVEKKGDAAFYIIRPGCPNQETFTILYPKG
jgi:hypothetical protein